MGTHLALNPGPQAAPDHRDRIIHSLEDENRDLKEQLRQAQAELAIARNANGAAVSRLRAVLSPLYQGLQQVFGEMSAFDDVPISNGTSQQSNKKLAIWESWKKKLGGQQADFINALLEHEQMTAAQLRVAMQCGKNAVYQVASKLGKLGLVEQSNGKYTLKEL